MAKLASLETVATTLVVPLEEAGRHAAGWVAIDAANCWSTFLRRYYLASATGGWCVAGTQVIPSPFSNEVDAITYAVTQLRPNSAQFGPPWTHREEPNWLDPGTVSTLLNRLGCSNEAGFHAAISIGSSVHQDLLTYRNFVGHRNRETALKLRNLIGAYQRTNLTRRAPPVTDPLEMPLQLVSRKPYSLLTLWLTDLYTMVSLVPE
jgi:hypothetical protein